MNPCIGPDNNNEHFLEFPIDSYPNEEFSSVSFYDLLGNECLDDLDPESINNCNEFNFTEAELKKCLKADDNELFYLMSEVS